MEKQLEQYQNKELQPYHDDSQEQKTSKQEEYFDPQLSKKKKIIYWLYLIILFVFIAIILSLISSAYDPVQNFLKSDNFYFANQVVHEWNKGFVKDIKVVSSKDCPAGYQHAFTYNWRGTGFGCFCQSSKNTSFVLQAYCSPALIQSNCTNIENQVKRQTYYWKNNSNICIKRSDVSFANEKKYDNTNKICGSSQSLVVVPTSEPCPLVNISMNSFYLQDHVITANDASQILPTIYGAYNSTSPFSFYSYPVSKFSVSEYQFCLINQDTGSSPEHLDFVLLTVPKGCAQLGNYTQIDETNEITFYLNNPTLQSLITVKGFPQAGNWKYKLGFASVPSWTYRCRHNLNKKLSIAQTSQQFNFQIFSLLKGGSFLIISCCIIIGIQIFILSLRRFLNNSIYPIGYKQVYMPDRFWWQMSRYIIDILCKTLILIFSIIFTINGYLDWRWYKQVQNQNCHHDNTQIIVNIILPYQYIHNIIFKNSLTCSLLVITMIIIDIFHFYYIYLNQLSYFLVDSNKILINSQNPNRNQSLDKLNNLKWLQIENIEQLQGDRQNNNDDQLRITMAHNMFNNDNYEQLNSPLKKKKKKKIPGKKLFNNNINNNNNDNNNDINPFDLNDDIFNIENIQQPTTTIVLDNNENNKKRKYNNRKRK